jgi:hypothetical protein
VFLDSASGGVWLEVVIVLSMVVPLSLVGVVCWWAWKAKKRDDAAELLARQRDAED